MPFTIDEESLLIKGRKGDTATFNFDFNQDMSDYTIHFYVKKNINSTELVIDKKCEKPVDPLVVIKLTADDTGKLSANGVNYNTYYWGVRISKGTDFVQTIIPQEFGNPPMMYIYPEIGGV